MIKKVTGTSKPKTFNKKCRNMTLAKVKEQNGMTLAKVKEQEWACDSCKSKGTRVGMTLAKVKEQEWA